MRRVSHGAHREHTEGHRGRSRHFARSAFSPLSGAPCVLGVSPCETPSFFHPTPHPCRRRGQQSIDRVPQVAIRLKSRRRSKQPSPRYRNDRVRTSGKENGHEQHEPAFGDSRIAGSGGDGSPGAALHRQCGRRDRDRLAGTGLRPGGGRRFPQDGCRLREGQRQQDRPQRHAVPGAESEGDIRDHQRGGPGPDFP